MTETLKSFREQLRDLLKDHAIKTLPEGQSFDLSSGEKSRVYCDVRKVSLQGGWAVKILADTLRIDAETHFGTIGAFAGVALGGSHLASIAATHHPLAHRALHTIHVRKEPKQHGTRNLIEAPEMDKSLSRVVLLEDVVTTGASVLKALQALQAEHYNVVGILAVVDRRDEWCFTEQRPDLGGVPFETLFRIEELASL